MSYPEDYALDEGQQRFWRDMSGGRRGPHIVCLCGSTRFWRDFRDEGLRETLAGNIVLSIGIHAPDAETFAGHHGSEYKAVKEQLDQLHLWKVALADEVLILNVGGYLGHSTLKEITHARSLGKPLRFLEEDWFWSRVALGAKDDCWEWSGPRLPAGYGMCRDSAAGGYSHRFAFEHANAVHADGFSVLHRCDNPPCVNPGHLFLGTQGDNMHDMWAKGRGTRPILRGEENGRAKLTGEQVDEIRARYEAGGTTYRQLAAEYGVHFSLIGYIVRGEKWSAR